MNVTNGFQSTYEAGNSGDPDFGTLPTGEIYAFHPGGANIVLADGAVRLLAVGTNVSVVAALITRAGGETAAADQQSVYLP